MTICDVPLDRKQCQEFAEKYRREAFMYHDWKIKYAKRRHECSKSMDFRVWDELDFAIAIARLYEAWWTYRASMIVPC